MLHTPAEDSGGRGSSFNQRRSGYHSNEDQTEDLKVNTARPLHGSEIHVEGTKDV